MKYETWMELWSRCHQPGVSGPSLVAWPDGGALLHQPAIVVEMFGLIGDVVAAAAGSEAKHG